MQSSDLISPEYLAMQRQMHAAPKGYGGKGDKWAAEVERLAWAGERVLGRPVTILDYGCGQGSLGRSLRAKGQRVLDYDPAIHGKDKLPAAADLVVCTDVLEHIEEDKIAAVLDHLRSLTVWRLFAVIATVEASKTLPDGRNAHILLQDRTWWFEQMERAGRFDWQGPVACREHKEFAGVWSPNP